MLDLTQLLPFVAAAFALNLTPGADMTYVIARSATQGRGAGHRRQPRHRRRQLRPQRAGGARRVGDPAAF